MEALATPANGYIKPGDPANSAFLTHWIAPGGPMGSVFNAQSDFAPGYTCREIVNLWVTKNCPLVDMTDFALRLSTPTARRDRHRTGRIFGMGSVH